MKKTLKKVYSVVINVLIVLVAVLAIALVGVRLFGLTPYAVISGSMEPEYPVGSVIYIQNISADELKVDDSITYDCSGVTVTHRIVDIVNDPQTGLCFKTKGDANNIADDGYVMPSQIIGKALFGIPIIGYIAYAIQTPVGMITAVGITAILVLLSFMSDIFFSDDKRKPSQKEE